MAVLGVRETIATLLSVKPLVFASTSQAVMGPARNAASVLRSVAPSAPLSGMAGGGPVKTDVRKGKSEGPDRQRMVSVVLYAPRWTVASDMAMGGDSSMSPNLTSKYGGASRWAWPVVEQAMPGIYERMVATIEVVQNTVTVKMRY